MSYIGNNDFGARKKSDKPISNEELRSGIKLWLQQNTGDLIHCNRLNGIFHWKHCPVLMQEDGKPTESCGDCNIYKRRAAHGKLGLGRQGRSRISDTEGIGGEIEIQPEYPVCILTGGEDRPPTLQDWS